MVFARPRSMLFVLCGGIGLAALAACSSGQVGSPSQQGGGGGGVNQTGGAGTNQTGGASNPSGGAGTPTTQTGGTSTTNMGQPASTGSMTGTGTQTGTTAGSTATGTGTMTPVNTETPPGMMQTIASGPPPSGTCGGQVLPEQFIVLCSGCHTPSGAANTRYPDLFNYKGTEAAFNAQVRKGGGLMAAYGTNLIGDPDISAIFAYFQGSKRGPNMISLGGVTPLFSPTDAVNPPIVFTRMSDGALITRGAGRVRGRHEKQGSFGPFLDNYFDDRTYGFIIEDWTPTGKNQIQVTYLPVKMPDHNGNRITNWRSWKSQGNNATFDSNRYAVDIMPAQIPALDPVAKGPTAPFAFQQQALETMPPGGRTMTVGQNYEFEIGVFISPTALTTPGSRDSYYTDTFRYQIGIGGLTPNNLDYNMSPGPVPDARLGGDTTVAWLYDNAGAIEVGGQSEQYMYFDEFALNIQHENVQNFVQGRRIFHTNFTTGAHFEAPGPANVIMQDANPPLTAEMGKAGPLAQTTMCMNCHINNGPGQLLTGPLGTTSSMAFKLPAGILGSQLRQQQGSASVASMTTKSVTLGDGTAVTLSRPVFNVTSTMGDVSHYSARLARKLPGLGLLEAIDETTLLNRADPLDCNKDGIAGRPNYIKDPGNGALRIGRFGWKAEKVSIEHQVADAANLDLDVGSALIPNSQGKAGLTSDEFTKLVTYMRLIGVAPQRNALDPQVMAGEQLFKTVGCADCHVPDVMTGANHPFSELRLQAIKPFTDLLLHDMGPDLADNSGVAAPDRTNPLAPAGASEWRTPPLWGIGLYAVINGHTGLLHDGRAASPLEAVLWHGGEATNVKANFMALSAADRASLLAYVNSL
jgi:CxxC motif-containing protein (DUF1111 family)